MATSKTTKSKATTTATDSPIDDLFGDIGTVEGVTLSRKAGAVSTGTGNRPGRVRDYVAKPPTAGDLVSWGQGAQGAKLSPFEVLKSEAYAHLVEMLSLDNQATVRRALESDTFGPFVVTVGNDTVTDVIGAMTDAYRAVTGRFEHRSVSILENLAPLFDRDDDISDPRDVVYGRQALARHAFSVLGIEANISGDWQDLTATFTVDPWEALFKGTGPNNMAKALVELYSGLFTPEGRANLAKVVSSADDKRLSQLAITSARFLTDASRVAPENIKEAASALAERVPTGIANKIGDDELKLSTVKGMAV